MSAGKVARATWNRSEQKAVIVGIVCESEHDTANSFWLLESGKGSAGILSLVRGKEGRLELATLFGERSLFRTIRRLFVLFSTFWS